jgi:Ser/Thr protein kinase RdoA (MazF antagonist)
LLAEWVGRDRPARRAALEAYSAIRPLGDVETALIPIFERSTALLSGGHWIRWHFLEHRVFESPTAVREGLQRCVERLVEAVEESLRAL